MNATQHPKNTPFFSVPDLSCSDSLTDDNAENVEIVDYHWEHGTWPSLNTNYPPFIPGKFLNGDSMKSAYRSGLFQGPCRAL